MGQMGCGRFGMTDWIDQVAALKGLEPAARAFVADLQPFEVNRVAACSRRGACSGFAVSALGDDPRLRQFGDGAR